MPSFSGGQLRQCDAKLEAAGWTPADVTLLGQMEVEDLRKLRDQVRRHNIIAAIEQGLTELWLHPDQRTSWAKGWVIHRHLVDNNLLADCVGDEGLNVIKAEEKKRPGFYQKHFGGKAIFAWRSVRDGRVSYLDKSEGGLYRNRVRLDDYCNSNDPALRFRMK